MKTRLFVGCGLSLSITLACFTLLSPSSAQAAEIPGLFGTGVDETQALLPAGTVDAHYTLTVSPDSNFPGPETYTLQPGFPVGPWLAEGPNSRWIAPRLGGSANAAPGRYTYTTSFDLTGYDPATAQITGQVAADDLLVAVNLNGVSVGVTAGGFANLHAFKIPVGGPFIDGANTLDFIVENGGTDLNPTGFRVELKGTAIAPAEPPTISQSPTDFEAGVGDTVRLTVEALGTPPLSYQWRFKGTDISGATESTFLLKNAQTENAGQYTVKVSNASGGVESPSATVTILKPFPGIYPTGVDDHRELLPDGEVDPHYVLTLNADSDSATETYAQSTIPAPPWVANGPLSRWIGPRVDATAAGGNYVYQLKLDLTGFDPSTAYLAGRWTTDDGGSLFLNGADTGFKTSGFTDFSTFKLTQGFVTGTNILEFRVVNGGLNPTGLRVENIRGTASPKVVKDFAPVIVTAPKTQTNYVSGKLTLTVVADGTQPLSYQWYHNGGAVKDATSSSFTVAFLTESDGGSYEVQVSNALGKASAVSRLTVISPHYGFFNTGVDDANVKLPFGTLDPHYLMIQSPDAVYGGLIPYVTAGPIPPWFANDENSAWIAPRGDNSATAAPGTYVYRVLFLIENPDEVATANLSANVGTDDGNQGAYLNGVKVSLGNSGFGSLTPLSITEGGPFVAGINYLDFVILNGGTDPNPTGLRVDDAQLTGVTTRPYLMIANTADGVRLMWPADSTYRLEESTNLNGPWAPSTAAIEVVDTLNVGLVPPGAAQTFFRLAQ